MDLTESEQIEIDALKARFEYMQYLGDKRECDLAYTDMLPTDTQEYCRTSPAEKIEEYQILGWKEPAPNQNQASDIARVCRHVAELISRGYLHRSDLKGLNVKQVREIAGRTQKRMKDTDTGVLSINVGQFR